jgi:DnaJ-class molecular chaperone
MCKGKGAFDTWEKPCELGNMHKKMDCPVCNGQCYIPNSQSLQKCQKCHGKGGFDTWDKPALRMNMHYRTQCVLCSGRCWVQGQAPQAPPQQQPWGNQGASQAPPQQQGS